MNPLEGSNRSRITCASWSAPGTDQVDRFSARRQPALRSKDRLVLGAGGVIITVQVSSHDQTVTSLISGCKDRCDGADAPR